MDINAGLLYYPPIVLVGIFYQPLWIAILPALYSTVSLILLLVIIGKEAWSIWCWSCAIITVWAYVYIPVSNWMIKKHQEESTESVDTAFGDGCFSRIMFSKTEEHMIRWGFFVV
eukprot:988797_1